MSVSVKLSIVGFGVHDAKLTLTAAANGAITVKTALEAFKAASKYPFTYKVVESPFRQGVHLVFAITYKGTELSSVLAKSTGEEERVWQFYVLDKSGKPIPNNSGQGRKPFDVFELENGFTVIWRLVVVIKQPINLAKRVRNNTTPEQADARENTYKLN